VADTTVQEANITYPTDTKLRRRVIETLWRLGEDAGITWERSHRRLVPRLLRTRTNRMAKQRWRAEKRLKTYAWRLLRQYERQASPGWKLIHEEQLAVCRQVLSQQTHDKNKVYSLHDPTVRCIAKGKAHKKYEFGRKASVAMLRESGVIVAAVSFEDNLYDGDTIEPTLIHANANADKVFDSCLVDLGYLGRPNFGSTEILTPRRKPSGGNYYQRRKQRRRFNRRSAIEPVIGHLKNDYRMARCFLRGAIGSSQNLLLAAAAWNFRKWMRESIFGRIFALLRTLFPTAKPTTGASASLYQHLSCLLKMAPAGS
jgi:IS5 family transposase